MDGSNYLILFIIFFILLSFFLYIFYANPYHILNFARIPIMILCVIIVLGFFIFIEYYTSKRVFVGDTTRELWINFSRYCYKYSYYLFYVLMISIIGYVLFKTVEKGIMYSFNYSFWVTIGLLVLVLALIQSSSSNITFDNPTVELIKNFIMYIPCLITDLIDYIKKDYTNTPSTVFIVFLFLVVYIFLFYLIPFFRKQMYKNDGIFLIDKSLPLNTNILSITSESLNQKIKDKRPFYDKWFQKMIELDSRTRNSGKDIEFKKTIDSSLNLAIPPDSITLPYYLRNLENFTSLQNEDSNIISWNLFKSRAKEYDSSLDDAYSPQDYKERMRNYIENHPQILTVLEKAQYMYSSAFASWDTLKSVPSLLKGTPSSVPTYSYHYAIASWVYLQQIEANDPQMIYSFGSRPSLYFDPIDSSLMIALNYGTPKQKIIYRTSSILYQRWNFIVMNYRYGTLDLFINNNLVGTYPDVLTYLDPDDLLLVGSTDNKNLGGICNMKYYELPLNVRKINDIYKTFHNKKIPL